MIKLKEFIGQHTLQDIIQLENQDEQFIALQEARNYIRKNYTDNEQNRNLFLLLIIQNGLIAFQIAGSGPKRRAEFADKVQHSFGTLLELQSNNTQWRYKFLTSSRYNKRLYNNKHKRLQKFYESSKHISNRQDQDMMTVRQFLAQAMSQKPQSKTISFTVKMFGYGLRIIQGKVLYYPHAIPIPVDSRLSKIYQQEHNITSKTNEKIIQNFYQQLADTHQIPALHLDSLLRIKYRHTFTKN